MLTAFFNPIQYLNLISMALSHIISSGMLEGYICESFECNVWEILILPYPFHTRRCLKTLCSDVPLCESECQMLNSF